MLLAIFLASLPIRTLAVHYEFFASSDVFIESQSFNLTPQNMPVVSYQGNDTRIQLITDTQYYATTDVSGSTYTPESNLSNDAIRIALGFGCDLQPSPVLTLRSRLLTTFGHRSSINGRYYFYDPSGYTQSGQTTESGFSLPNTLPSGAEMISWDQNPTWSVSLASLFRWSDRYSLGPSYTYTQTNISSSEYLKNTSTTSNTYPFYVGNLRMQQHTLGAVWTYRITPQTQFHCGIESSKQYQTAKKEIYFTYDENQNITGRYLPSTTTSTDSNWNGVSCTDDAQCTCVGSDCNVTTTSYEIAPHLNLDRLITRVSVGLDFSLSYFEPGF